MHKKKVVVYVQGQILPIILEGVMVKLVKITIYYYDKLYSAYGCASSIK